MSFATEVMKAACAAEETVSADIFESLSPIEGTGFSHEGESSFLGSPLPPPPGSTPLAPSPLPFSPSPYSSPSISLLKNGQLEGAAGAAVTAEPLMMGHEKKRGKRKSELSSQTRKNGKRKKQQRQPRTRQEEQEQNECKKRRTSEKGKSKKGESKGRKTCKSSKRKCQKDDPKDVKEAPLLEVVVESRNQKKAMKTKKNALASLSGNKHNLYAANERIGLFVVFNELFTLLRPFLPPSDLQPAKIGTRGERGSKKTLTAQMDHFALEAFNLNMLGLRDAVLIIAVFIFRWIAPLGDLMFVSHMADGEEKLEAFPIQLDMWDDFQKLSSNFWYACDFLDYFFALWSDFLDQRKWFVIDQVSRSHGSQLVTNENPLYEETTPLLSFEQFSEHLAKEEVKKKKRRRNSETETRVEGEESREKETRVEGEEAKVETEVDQNGEEDFRTSALGLDLNFDFKGTDFKGIEHSATMLLQSKRVPEHHFPFDCSTLTDGEMMEMAVQSAGNYSPVPSWPSFLKFAESPRSGGGQTPLFSPDSTDFLPDTQL